MQFFGRRVRWSAWFALAVGLADMASAATIGVNHYQFDPTKDTPLLRQLSSSAVPLRMTFYWHDVEGAADYNDAQVAEAAEAGVPILGVLGYSTPDASSIPTNFDFTELSPFNISWHSRSGALTWGSVGEAGTARYVWQATFEDGQTYVRAVEARPANENEFVHGEAEFAVPAGHSVMLWARIGFMGNPYSTGHAVFSVTYADGNDYRTLASIEKGYDGTVAFLIADLSSLAGTTVKLFLNVDAVPGHAAGSPMWQAAGVIIDGVPLTMTQGVGENLQSVIYYPPKDFDAFAAYAGDLARRYPQIHEWEVWNEPNISFFWRPAVSGQAYSELLKKVYRAVKAGNPNALVVLGGLSPGPGDEATDAVPAADFLSEIYHNGGGPFFDVVGYHVYGESDLQEWLPQSLLEIRQVMGAHGDGSKPVWITEVGWYTSGDGSEAEQADCLRRAMAILDNTPYIERVYWYTLLDTGTSDDPELNYGLFHSDGSPKLAVSAFASALQQ